MNEVNNDYFQKLQRDDCKVSIITVSYNCEDTIVDTILSVASQNYPLIEHIIVDGVSTDNTLLLIKKHQTKILKFISEPDSGIYDAINRGIGLATGDLIGILNADDIYFENSCISSVVEMLKSKKVEAICGDLVYVERLNIERIIRYYSSKNFKPEYFAYGMMPAHPAFFVAKYCYQKYGLYKTDYMIAADFELLARLLKVYNIKYCCLPKVLVKMRMGGISTRNFKSNFILNNEILKACKENEIKTNIIKIYLKYFIKIMQLIKRPEIR